MADGPGLPTTVLADAGFASEGAAAALEKRGIEPLVAVGRQPRRPYDLRPPPDPETPQREPEAARRCEMAAKLLTDEAKAKYKLRQQTIEPVFGIIESVLGFRRFRLRGSAKVTSEWRLVALAYNGERMAKLAASAGHQPA
jgi:hypothetical protein